MPENRGSDPAVSGLLNKFHERLERKKEAMTQIAVLQQEVREIDVDLQECAQALKTMAKFLGISLPDLPLDERGIQSDEKQCLPDQSEQSLRSQVENFLRAAHPGSRRAKEVREQFAGSIPDKTVGMTLHRLRNDGIIKADGWDWVWVPVGERVPPAKTKVESERPPAKVAGVATATRSSK